MTKVRGRVRLCACCDLFANPTHWTHSSLSHAHKTHKTQHNAAPQPPHPHPQPQIDAREAAAAIGVTADTVKVGPNADWASPFTELSEAQRARVDAQVEATYGQFLSRVAEGRGKSVEEVRRVAKGRVYTGRQALEVRLGARLGVWGLGCVCVCLCL